MASKDPFLDQFSDIGPGRADSFYGVPTGRDSMYDTSSLDYRPVSHGDTMSRSYHQSSTANYPPTANTGYAGDRKSAYAITGMQQSNNSGNLSLLDSRQSYNGAPSVAHDNRKSMQVHVGVAEDDAVQQGYEHRDRDRERSARRESRRQSRSDREREREREYAY